MIEWNANYITGYTFIDEQHQKIFEIANEVSRLVNSEDEISSNQLSDVIEELIDYTIYHFAYEEEFWIENNSDVIDIQKSDHEWFTKEIYQLDYRGMDVSKVLFTKNIFEKLVHWITNHVIQEIYEIQSIYSKTHLSDKVILR